MCVPVISQITRRSDALGSEPPRIHLRCELQGHLQRMALFAVNTGLRDKELCGLQWSWEQRVPELDSGNIKTHGVRPSFTKGQEQAGARRPVERHRAGSRGGDARPASGACVHLGERRRRARPRGPASELRVDQRPAQSGGYSKVLGKEAPAGFRHLRVHDLRHTFGRRLRAAGVSREDRKDLLGHKSGDVTTDYSVAELSNLLDAANKVVRSRESPALTVIRIAA